jgi:hypothetical protein
MLLTDFSKYLLVLSGVLLSVITTIKSELKFSV